LVENYAPQKKTTTGFRQHSYIVFDFLKSQTKTAMELIPVADETYKSLLLSIKVS
jgi:hypothetical protein